MSQPENQVPNPIPDPSPSSSPKPDPKPEPVNTEPEVTSAGTLKRRRDEANDAEAKEETTDNAPPASKRRVKATQDVIYRIVLPSRQIGKVIGRAGHRIQKIRDETKATIKIADAISRHEERVVIISSKLDDKVFSDAENALHQIVSLILKDDGTPETVQVGQGHVAANTIRLLIAESQAGCLIGHSGQNIENLRNSSGASISILSPNQLPPCASAHESDRVVQISGEVPTVLRAVVEIGCQLRVNPPKQVVSINPAHNIGFHSQPQHYVDPSSVEYVTLDIMVPENLIGGLIGRFGANISRIRNESGASIKVHGARGEQMQRQIHVSGNSQQVDLARQRVDEYVYAELMRQVGGQPPQAAGVVQQVVTQPPIPAMTNPLYPGYGPPPPHGHYPNSGYEAGKMAPLPPPYASTFPPPTYASPFPPPYTGNPPPYTANPPEQLPPPPPYYGYQPYHGPPL